MKIAIVGSGISGLGAAWRLGRHHDVTLFEADERAGGHANTVDVTLDGRTHGVDTGFLVYNERTYPALIALFEALGVPVAATDMSFSVSVGDGALEWGGADLRSLFAQPANALSPRFWSMLVDMRRFNREATAIAIGGLAHGEASIGDYLVDQRYGRSFVDGYLMPMAAAIWSCPIDRMMAFPLTTFVRFWHNHGLLQVRNRPRWFTVAGGSRQYVDRIVAGIGRVELSTPVRRVIPADERAPARVVTDRGTMRFDHVVVATHSDQAAAMLSDGGDETPRPAHLASIGYQPNTAWLHTDTAQMPRRRGAWAAWNYLSRGTRDAPSLAVTYWLNRLQPLPFETDVFVTLNPLREPPPERVLGRFAYAHPVFDAAAMRAREALLPLQGDGGVWLCGAWFGHGFHEDGLKSGLAVADAIDALARQRDAQAASAHTRLRAA
ncbi:MAG: NAD(P)/FAD-dependent oxidoreductase [Lautropia sp.]